jgi:hypothetical protein
MRLRKSTPQQRTLFVNITLPTRHPIEEFSHAEISSSSVDVRGHQPKLVSLDNRYSP